LPAIEIEEPGERLRLKGIDHKYIKKIAEPPAGVPPRNGDDAQTI